MDSKLLAILSELTEEENTILDGRKDMNRELYMQGEGNTINGSKLLLDDELVAMRPHTRFIDFPEHSHDFVEVIYVYAGHMTNIVKGQEICLQQGELLFLSPGVVHAIRKAGKEDVAINFIVLPELFSAALRIIGPEPTPLRHFLTGCLCGQDIGPDYLHFRVSDVPAIQHLLEDMLWVLMGETPNKRRITQTAMALLVVQLLDHTEKLTADTQKDAIVLKVLRYLESNYANCTLEDMAEHLHHDPNWLCRKIKRKTGKTYTQLVQEKRLSQAAFLIRTTDRNIAEIAVAVGYENVSYFHRIFAATYGMSPKHYRDSRRLHHRTLF